MRCIEKTFACDRIVDKGLFKRHGFNAGEEILQVRWRQEIINCVYIRGRMNTFQRPVCNSN
jgi:hypothetical protein